jgi:hypothetical protein
VEKKNNDLGDRAPTSKIRMLALMVLFCERLLGDQSSEGQIREQAARLYDQWVCFVRHDRWFSDTVRPQHLSAEGESLIARMESFLDALVDRLRKTGVAQSRCRGKSAKPPEGRFVARTVSIIEEKGRRVLLAMAARIGGKSE